TECFRKSEGVFRSIHPTHPLAAWGRNAQELMSGHEKSKSMYDELSPYKKLLDLNVKNFCIGVNFDHMILIRIVDDLYKDYPINPYIEDKIYNVQVYGYNGELIDMQTVCHDPDYFSLERENMKLFPYMKNKITFGHLGKAYTWVLDSQDMFNIQVECAKKGIFPFRKLKFKKQ
ncbi:MAG: AAC(3) family N-acetyltransferase, partial [Prevotellaceae bacterium]|nr:AAC(3) family N-acetyltransferase [Prevotellaceae bacterium]